jgi:hypothetical protein
MTNLNFIIPCACISIYMNTHPKEHNFNNQGVNRDLISQVMFNFVNAAQTFLGS